MPPKAIPDRWIPYKPCGEVIEGTRIICFKVPLKLSVQEKVPGLDKIWDIPTVLKDIPKLGAVIDLTNTARYYNPADFLKANVIHRKILMPGRVIPPESSVQEFMDAVDEFLAKSKDSLIGVHCTHGLNRTGYMVCRYMRDRMGMDATVAISRFEAARGYKIERDIYRNDILRKPGGTSHDGKEAEIIPVEDKHDDANYRSPLDCGDGSPSYDSRKRFGNSRPNNDRDRYNRYTDKRNTNAGRSNGAFFTTYTDRYKNDRDFSAQSKGDTQNRPWRNNGESSNMPRNTFDNFNRNNNRYQDRAYQDRPRYNEGLTHDDVGYDSRQGNPRFDGRPRYDHRPRYERPPHDDRQRFDRPRYGDNPRYNNRSPNE